MTSWFHLITFSAFRTPTRTELYLKRLKVAEDRLLEIELEQIALKAEILGLHDRIAFVNTVRVSR